MYHTVLLQTKWGIHKVPNGNSTRKRGWELFELVPFAVSAWGLFFH